MNLGLVESFLFSCWENLVKLQQSLLSLELDPLFEKHGHLKIVLRHFDTKLLKDVEMVVVSPGVPMESHGLSFLLQSGKRILSELDFAAEILLRSIKILVVNRTNGKPTIATFFFGQMLSHLGIEVFFEENLGIPL